MKYSIYLLCVLSFRNCAKGSTISDTFKDQFFHTENAFGIPSQCKNDLRQLVNDLSLSPLSWASKMLDASSKIRSGIELFGDDIGQYDECLRAKNDNGSIFGKYCLGKISLAKKNEVMEYHINLKENLLNNIVALRGSTDMLSERLTLTWAGCLPNSCSAESFNAIFNEIFHILLPDLNVAFNEAKCSTKNDDSELTTSAIIATAMFGCVFAIMILQTGYDLYCYYYEKEPRILFIAFSMYSNSKKLFKLSKGNMQLECLNGLKFYSMLWVVLGHTYFLTISAAVSSNIDILMWGDSLHSMLVVSGTLAVDTFFVVGGALVTYVYMKTFEKGTKINIAIYYLHRYIRLTPPLAALVYAVATLYPYLGSGPYWFNVRIDQELCQESWWSTLLYIQNYASVPKLCIGTTWYLCVDMQLYILSPLFLYGMKRFTNWTIGGLIGVIFIICGTNFYYAWHDHYAAIISNVHVDSTPYLSQFYIKTHVRAGAWLLGVIVGYFIHEIKSNKLKFRIHKVLNIFLWLCTFGLLLFCIFIGHDSLRTADYKVLGNSLHIAFIRQLWSLGIGWIMMSCVLGYGGPVNWFLSLPVYQVFNRFLYSIYLLHYFIITLWSSSTRVPVYFSDMMMAYYFWGNLCFTCIISYFWVLAFESPVIVLEKIILGPFSNRNGAGK